MDFREIRQAPEARLRRAPAGAPLRTIARLGALVLAAAAVAAGGFGAGGQEAVDKADQKDDSRQLKLRSSSPVRVDGRAADNRAGTAQIDAERAQLNAQLLDTARLVQRSEATLSAIEARIGELEEQEKMKRGSLTQRHDSIAQLLAALQRMGRNPPPVIVTRREDALQMVRSAMLLAHAFPELKTQTDDIVAELHELLRVKTNIQNEGQKLRTETDRLNKTREGLAKLLAAKRQATERQGELDEVRKAAAEVADIARGVSDLGDLIARLDKTIAERTKLGAYERESKGQEATQAADPKARSQLPTFELSPAGSPLVANLARMKPAVAFHLAKAQLPLPAHGRRVLAFGERTQYGSPSKGIVIETRPGAQITSPCDGWVIYASEFRTYGQLLIINAGNGYYVLLAGLSQIDAQVGQFVLTSEPVGTMSATAKGKAQDNAPVLYVEFRKDGRPIDPEPWWAEGPQKVQG